MRIEPRTPVQVQANRIDMRLEEVFRMIDALALRAGDPGIGRAGISVLAARRAVRKHMSPEDQEVTKNAPL